MNNLTRKQRFLAKLKEIQAKCKNYALTSSLHGLHHIAERENSRFRRILWAVVLIACLSLLCWNLQVLAQRYVTFAKQTSIRLNFGLLEFPAVTICSINPLKDSLTSSDPQIKQIISAYHAASGIIDNPRLAEEAALLYGLSKSDEKMQRQTRLEWLMSYYMATLRENETFIEKAIGFDDIVKNCAYNAATCTEKDFTPIYDPNYGQCYVFNFRGEAAKTTRSGPSYGLKMLLYTNVSEYIESVTSIGIRIAIHEQNTYPFPDTYGYSVQPGSAVALSIRSIRNERLNVGDTKCADDFGIEEYLYDGAYTMEGCLRSCRQQEIVSHCRCADSRFPKPETTSFCNITDMLSRECMETWVWEVSDCECPMRCRERAFEVTTSSSRWRIQSARTLCNGNACDETIDSAMLVNIYFENLNEKVTIETYSYPTINFMSDTAGQCGFWIGLSFLSLIEFALLLGSIAKGVLPSPYHLRHLYYERKFRRELGPTPIFVTPRSSVMSDEATVESIKSTYLPPSRPTIAYNYRKRNPLGTRPSIIGKESRRRRVK